LETPTGKTRGWAGVIVTPPADFPAKILLKIKNNEFNKQSINVQ
jgi:hypothetical protein